MGRNLSVKLSARSTAWRGERESSSASSPAEAPPRDFFWDMAAEAAAGRGWGRFRFGSLAPSSPP
jgi:hypothetical protein